MPKLFAIALMLLLNNSFAAADYAREKKWADEIVPGIVVGDPVYLEMDTGHKFLTIYTEAKDAQVGVIVVHGIGVHPDWNMVGTLRTRLAEAGYTTLSVQMPVLANEAKSEQYDALFAEAAARLDVAVSFLQAKGYKKVAIVSHSMGSAMSRLYVRNNSSKLVAWAALGMGHGYDYRDIHTAVLDMYGENDLPSVLDRVTGRADSLKGNSLSMQIKVPKSDHFYTNHEDEMVSDVKCFLDGFK